MTAYAAKRDDVIYLTHDWHGGDRDVVIECHTKRIVTNAKVQQCAGNSAKRRHEVAKGERMLVQKAKVEGYWSGYRLCLQCCDEWLDSLDVAEDGA